MLLCFLLFIAGGVAFGDTFSDNFNNTTTYLHPVNPNTKWSQLGSQLGATCTTSGIFWQEPLGGGNSAVRILDNNPSCHNPGLGANNAQYYTIAPATIQAFIKPNANAGNAGIGFGVYSDTGEYLSGGIAAGLYYDSAHSTWIFFISESSEYDPSATLLASRNVIINPLNFYQINMSSTISGSTLTITATLDGGNTITATPTLPIKESGIGLFVGGGGDFSFDDFSLDATPDSRHMVFKDVDIVENTPLDELFPSWSPDGKSIAFVRRDSVVPDIWNIWTKQIDPPLPSVKCTDNTAKTNLFGAPCFSPDQSYVLFWAKDPMTGQSEIRRVRADGSGGLQTILGDSSVNCSAPKIKDNILFYTRYITGQQMNLWSVLVSPDGLPVAGTEKQITNLPWWNPYPYMGGYDPINDRLSFFALSAGSPVGSDVYILDSVTAIRNGVQLPPTSYSDSRITRLVYGPNFQYAVCFSGDGSYLYYGEDTAGLFDIAYMDQHQGGSWQDLMSGAHFEIFAVDPDFPSNNFRLNYWRPYSQGQLHPSPDGTKLIYVADNQDDGDGVWDTDLYIVSLESKGSIPSAAGGEVSDGSGSILDVPAGTLSQDADISIKTPFPGDVPGADTLPPDSAKYIALARQIEVPPGLIFNPVYPPRLTIHYTHEEISGLNEATLKIFVYTESTLTWEPLPNCTVDTVNNTVSADLIHFSIFGVTGELSAAEVTVPNVTDAIWREEADAESVLNAFGFQVTKVYEHSITVLNGFAIRTDPPVGTQVPVGSPVTLYISSGPDKVIMPNLIGLTETQAQTLITSSRLVLFNTSREYSNQPVGQVIGQSPDAGLSVDPGRLVGISVSKGPQATTTVPNVTNAIFREEAIAEWILNAFGFQVTKVYEHSTTVLKGYAIRTDPPAGSVVPINSAVTLVISSGR
jgi:beta-lactam-binding protein with PASTA domain